MTAPLLAAACAALAALLTWLLVGHPDPVYVETPGPVTTLTQPGPTVTATKRVKVPGPTRTVVVSRDHQRAPLGWQAGDWSRFPAWVETAARCRARHESWNAGLWTAENPTSTASGALQWLDSSWQVQAERAELSAYPDHAADAAPRMQAFVFAYQAMHYGLYPWVGTGCPR